MVGICMHLVIFGKEGFGLFYIDRHRIVKQNDGGSNRGIIIYIYNNSLFVVDLLTCSCRGRHRCCRGRHRCCRGCCHQCFRKQKTITCKRIV
jgi:hypothetical protein